MVKADIDPSKLVFEVTETAAVADIDQARKFAESLNRVGCRFALDDFGSGFASFYYLKHLPISYLKIDGEFVKDLPRSPTDQLVIKALVSVADGLGIKTVAEFVEDAETLDLLRKFGVTYAQGYHIGRPEPLPDIDTPTVSEAEAAPAGPEPTKRLL
jgi:EAL domain-containing protein (putative c-di-GMP-specific phosphodiesterase class I)